GALRPRPPDAGSGWLAGPFPHDSCIRYSSPVSRRTKRPVSPMTMGRGADRAPGRCWAGERLAWRQNRHRASATAPGPPTRPVGLQTAQITEGVVILGRGEVGGDDREQARADRAPRCDVDAATARPVVTDRGVDNRGSRIQAVIGGAAPA